MIKAEYELWITIAQWRQNWIALTAIVVVPIHRVLYQPQLNSRAALGQAQATLQGNSIYFIVCSLYLNLPAPTRYNFDCYAY